MTWSPFRYVGNSVSFTEFSHILKKKKKTLLNYVLTWSPFEYVGSLVSFTEFTHIFKKKKKKKSPRKLLDKKNFLEPRDDSISLKCNTSKTWYVTLSAIIVLGEKSLWESRYKKTILPYEGKHHYKTLLPKGMQSHHENKHHYENVTWHL